MDRGHAAVMFTLAAPKSRAGVALDNSVLRIEGRVTLIDGILAAAVLFGLVLNTAASCVLVYYAMRETRATLTSQ